MIRSMIYMRSWNKWKFIEDLFLSAVGNWFESDASKAKVGREAGAIDSQSRSPVRRAVYSCRDKLPVIHHTE